MGLADAVGRDVAALAGELGLSCEEVSDDGFGGTIAVLVDRASPLAGAVVVMALWEGEATFRYVPGDDEARALSAGMDAGDVERCMEEVRAKAARLREAASPPGGDGGRK